MRALKTITLLILVAFVAQSCATILAGSYKQVRVDGYPPKAKVYVNGNFQGEAPTYIKVPRKHTQNVKVAIKADNFKSTEIEMTSKLSAGFLFLDIISGIIPLGVDLASGNIFAPYPKRIKYFLEPINNDYLSFNINDSVMVFSQKHLWKGRIIDMAGDIAVVRYTRFANFYEKTIQKKEKVIKIKKFHTSQLRKIKK